MADDETTGSKPILNILAMGGKANPTLTVLAGREQIGKSFVLDLEEIVIGRAVDAHIRIDDEGVSRYHCRILLSQERVVIEDLKSKNGTLVNGTSVVTEVLHSGDKLQVGSSTVLRFAFQDFLEAEAAKKLFDQATRDTLTGIYNRTFLTEHLVKEFAFAKRHGHSLTVVMVDADRFKSVNDTFGHAGGDYVLKTIAEILQKTVRLEDVLGRFGGEEFLLVTRELSDTKAYQLAERLRKVVEKHDFRIGRTKVPVTVSLGVASTNKTEFETWQELVDAADRALYEAKEGGRNQVRPAPPKKK